jgi:preprotein translocase subunit SecD
VLLRPTHHEARLLPDPRLLLGPALATGSITSTASAQQVSTGQWVAQASFTGSGANTFNAIATAHYETPLADDLGGSLIAAPILLSKNFDTGFQISGGSGGFTQAQARNLALVLSSGAFPVQLRVIGTLPAS